MRSFCSLVVIFALMALAGCNSKDKVAGNMGKATPRAANPPTTPQPPGPPTPGDGARRITTVEVQEALSKGQAIIVDVRNDQAYKQGHIKGAILIPSSEIGDRINELPPDKLIVTYCS
jgi:3-mercaptopyruvate sulfurtransferase SseA